MILPSSTSFPSSSSSPSPFRTIQFTRRPLRLGRLGSVKKPRTMTDSSRDRTILVISTSIDPATDSVIEALEARGANVTKINTETYPYNQPGSFCFDQLGASFSWTGTRGSIWYRRVRSPEQPTSLPSDVHDYCCNEAKAFLVGSALASPLPIMSDPARVWAAENKILQLYAARQVGFEIPATCITNDPDDIRAFFHASSGNIVVKPLRSGYAEIGGEPHAVFTSRVSADHIDRLATVTPCPSIYQTLIPKDCDIRVTYVAGEVFAAEIDSQSDPDAVVDWRRTANAQLPHRVATLPDKLAALISDLMQNLGLLFGALDFVRTPEGDYVFLEINPNGQWLWLEDRLRFPISTRIADWLITHARGQ